MTHRFDKRVSALEGSNQPDLSPRAKAWLGWPLSEQEWAAVRKTEAPVDCDLSRLTPEAQRWLRQPAAYREI